MLETAQNKARSVAQHITCCASCLKRKAKSISFCRRHSWRQAPTPSRRVLPGGWHRALVESGECSTCRQRHSATAVWNVLITLARKRSFPATLPLQLPGCSYGNTLHTQPSKHRHTRLRRVLRHSKSNLDGPSKAFALQLTVVDLELIEYASENLKVGFFFAAITLLSAHCHVCQATLDQLRSCFRESVRNPGNVLREAEVHFIVKPANPHVLHELAAEKPQPPMSLMVQQIHAEPNQQL